MVALGQVKNVASTSHRLLSYILHSVSRMCIA